MGQPTDKWGAPSTSVSNKNPLVLPTGVRVTLLAQVGRLAGALGTMQGQLSNASQAIGCSSHGPPKTCILLSEIGATLRSAQREILHAADTLATTVCAPAGPGLLGGWWPSWEGCAGLVGWDVTSTVGGCESLGSVWV